MIMPCSKFEIKWYLFTQLEIHWIDEIHIKGQNDNEEKKEKKKTVF